MAKPQIPNTKYQIPQEAKLLAQGAEAKIFLNKEDQILKQRTKKSYRHKTLDNQLRTRRTKREAKILTKAKSIGANVPELLHTEKHILHLEQIKGDRLSQKLNNYPTKSQASIMQKLGRQVARLHKNNIIHADLTTSNIILKRPSASGLRQAQSKIYLIDFGLSYISTKTEDKAVDLHLLKQALEAKHYQKAKTLFQNFLKTYKDKIVIDRLKIVESRGRYKH
ncbi:Kae1-associated serine/threonine protein kinase [Methanococcoides sp. SA1]|nr:Kae1-associated serine/threonine protein kinase [Methanococcoides sp. SA1]